jgi:hypothetical protein
MGEFLFLHRFTLLLENLGNRLQGYAGVIDAVLLESRLVSVLRSTIVGSSVILKLAIVGFPVILKFAIVGSLVIFKYPADRFLVILISSRVRPCGMGHVFQLRF